MRTSTFSGRIGSQRVDELGPFIELLMRRRVRSYLEIGARHGDTFHAVMSALPPGSFGVAVDLPGGAWGTEKSRQPLLKACADLKALGYRVRSVFGDSRDAEIVEIFNAIGVDMETLDITGCSALSYLDVNGNPLSSIDLTGCAAILEADLAGNSLSESAVDAALAALDGFGLSNGYIGLSGGTNAIPSAAGLTSKSNLEGKGWTVTVNEA